MKKTNNGRFNNVLNCSQKIVEIRVICHRYACITLQMRNVTDVLNSFKENLIAPNMFLH